MYNAGRSPMSTRILVPIFFTLVMGAESSAQTYFDLTEEKKIEYRLDLLRKGIQQEDTSKIIAALAPNVSFDGRSNGPSSAFGQDFQALFDQGPQRQMLI